MGYIQGPDFPTAGFINGREGIVSAYRTGRGVIRVRARASIERNARNDKESIIVTELPYQVNKANLIEKISDLVKEKRITGISDLRDESDRDGIRVVIDLKRDETPGDHPEPALQIHPDGIDFRDNHARHRQRAAAGAEPQGNPLQVH